MRKILIVLDELFPVRGAPQVRIQNLLAALAEWNRFAIGGRLGEGTSPEGFTLLERPSERSPLRFIRFLLCLGRRSRSLAKQIVPDVIVLSVPKYEMLFFAPMLSKVTKKLILDFRDSLAFLDYGAYLAHFLPRRIASILGGAMSALNRVLQQRAIRAASVITVANEGIKNSLSHPNVVVIPNGVDTDAFQPVDKVWFDGNRPLRLVYLGNFAEKDLFEWINGLKKFTGIEVHLIGDGRNRERVREALTGVPSTFHGVIGHEQLPNLLSSMDLGFIFRKPGVDQSIPVCLFEYTAMNIPSVCNDTGIMARFVAGQSIGYVVKDEGEFHGLLETILREPAQLRRFERLHNLADASFSLRASREKFAALINQ